MPVFVPNVFCADITSIFGRFFISVRMCSPPVRFLQIPKPVRDISLHNSKKAGALYVNQHGPLDVRRSLCDIRSIPEQPASGDRIPAPMPVLRLRARRCGLASKSLPQMPRGGLGTLCKAGKHLGQRQSILKEHKYLPRTGSVFPSGAAATSGEAV